MYKYDMYKIPSLAILTLMLMMIPIASAESEIPDWVKNIAILWGNGEINDDEFIAAIQYLIDVGILSSPNVEIEYPANVHSDAMIGTIDRIIDGDTLIFNNDTYRLSLIDTPERGEDGFKEATDALTLLCPVGSTAYMELDSIVEHDTYGRHLGVVWCEGNDYSVTAGEYLYNNGHLVKFYTEFCGTMEAATPAWAEETDNWFYYSVCS